MADVEQSEADRSKHPAPVDCLVIGGGPAGLTAAIYLARFHLSVLVIDSGQSRAELIPCTHNHAGFPDGVSGAVLLDRMRRQALQFGAKIITDKVVAMAKIGNVFEANAGGTTFSAQCLLFASGVINRKPTMLGENDHAAALADGRLRYCPICDGYEVTDRRIAVLGSGETGCGEALFLRSYSADVTLIAPPEGHRLSPDQVTSLRSAGVAIAGICQAMTLGSNSVVLTVESEALAFDTVYPALGSDAGSGLAHKMGVDLTDEGYIKVDLHQRTSVPGLYAAGDVVIGLDQISHAMGGGGVAATTIRNDLAKQTPLLR